ncbi:MAG: prephenate dehydrogenase/arogenate dehydrogenase family protein [Desulfovibrio sp.]|jgi:prephenate dehydrogenase|nr:prephenate dehydrogenase/arogenate dehydrogenase family protein [Desulfovibrio sp.]
MNPSEANPAAPDSPAAGDARDGTGFAPLCVVGGKGRMGSLFLRECARAGYPVRGLEKAPDQDDGAAALSLSRLVLLCLPVTALESALRDIGPQLGPDHLLMDITSVKTLPLLWMERAFSGQIVGAHPLFGPEPRPEEMRVALVRGKRTGDAACREAEGLFRRIGCATFWTTAEEHDAGVSLAQSLNFTVSAAYFCALARHKGIEPFLTPSFRRHLEGARKHLTRDADMFCAFTAMNPEYPKALARYRSILEEALAGGLERIAAEAALWYAKFP